MESAGPGAEVALRRVFVAVVDEEEDARLLLVCAGTCRWGYVAYSDILSRCVFDGIGLGVCMYIQVSLKRWNEDRGKEYSFLRLDVYL